MNLANVSYPAPRPLSASKAGYESAKRVFDFFVSLISLLLFAPLMLVIAIAVSLESPGGAFFRQERVGKDGTRFQLLKFRSMRQGTPSISTADMQKQPVSPVTRVGGFLRRTSLDELPQLLNVLKGEMGLVGPRPALPSQTHLNELRGAAGVSILLPGITGWAQINGRDELSDEQKTAHDIYYLHYRSFKFDFTILVRTLGAVRSGRGNR